MKWVDWMPSQVLADLLCPTTSTLTLNGSQGQIVVLGTARWGYICVGSRLGGRRGVMGETGAAKGKGHLLGFSVHHRCSRASAVARVSRAAWPVLCFELDLHIVSAGQVPEERGDRVLCPCSRTREECCKEAPALPRLSRHLSGHVTLEQSPRLQAQICSSRPQLLLSLDRAPLALPGVLPACLPHLAQGRPLSLFRLRHAPHRDLWCPCVPFTYGRLTTAPLLGGTGIILTSAANCFSR